MRLLSPRTALGKGRDGKADAKRGMVRVLNGLVSYFEIAKGCCPCIVPQVGFLLVVPLG